MTCRVAAVSSRHSWRTDDCRRNGCGFNESGLNSAATVKAPSSRKPTPWHHHPARRTVALRRLWKNSAPSHRGKKGHLARKTSPLSYPLSPVFDSGEPVRSTLSTATGRRQEYHMLLPVRVELRPAELQIRRQRLGGAQDTSPSPPPHPN